MESHSGYVPVRSGEPGYRDGAAVIGWAENDRTENEGCFLPAEQEDEAEIEAVKLEWLLLAHGRYSYLKNPAA